MDRPRLTPVTPGTSWPGGDGIEVAVLPMTEGELASRIGLPLVRGYEDGLGPYAAIGGLLPSGTAVEFIFYELKPPPPAVLLRVDKGACYSAALDEALSVVRLSRDEAIEIVPLAALPLRD